MENMVNITPVVEAFIALVVAIITAFVIPWLKQKIGAEKLAQYSEWVTIAVQAAEQIYAGSGRGAEKKAYVLEFLQKKGFTLDMESIDKLIEAAVYDLPKYISIPAEAVANE